MQVQCIPLTSFIHGSVDAHEGRAVYFDHSTAGELERAGLIRIKRERVRVKLPQAPVIKPAEAGNARDVGQGQPPSVLPAAQVLPTPTLITSGRGRQSGRRNGT